MNNFIVFISKVMIVFGLLLPVTGHASILEDYQESYKMYLAATACMAAYRDRVGGFARDALRNSPKVEIGSENAGIGIVVNPGLNVPANSAANGARPAGAARRSISEPGEKLGMTLIAISEI